jgi:hypothetical protein
MIFRCSSADGSRCRRDIRTSCAFAHAGTRPPPDVSAVRCLEFAQPRESRRVGADFGMRPVCPRAQFVELAVGVRRMREAFHSRKVYPSGGGVYRRSTPRGLGV